MTGRRFTAVSLAVCLLFSTLALTSVGVVAGAQENDSLNAEFPDCETVRITGDAAYAEVYTSSYTERGGFDTDVISVDLSGDETVITEDELYGGNVGSYQDEFVIDGVAVFESDTGPVIGDFDNPNSQSCFDALPQPPENTDGSPTTAEPTTSPATETTTATPTTASTTTPTTTSTTTPTTTSATTPTTSADAANSPKQTTAAETTAVTASQDTETSTPSQSGATDTTAAAPQNSGASQEAASGDAGAGDDESTSVPFSVNASSGANETLVTYNVTGVLVNATDDATVTANASERAPNSTRAPTVEDDGFEPLSYLAVNGTVDETAVENLSVAATVNGSYLAALDGNASDVQFHAWDAANDTWVTVNTSVANVTDNASIANATGNVSVANATENAPVTNAVGNASIDNVTTDTAVANATYVFEADISYGVYALGLNRSHVVVTDVTAPENASVDETVTVEATVQNTGRANGTHTATFSVAGTQVDESVVTLGANESAVVTFDWRFETPGTHTVAVDNQTVDVNVSAAEDAATPQEGDTATDSASSLQLEAPGSLNRLGVGIVVAPLALAGGALLTRYRK